jgi:hypothetical protein
MDVWVQESLFGAETIIARKSPGSGRGSSWSGRGRRGDWSRVTRDPAVAISYSETTNVGVDFRLGLARALAQLTPDQRRALRATVEGQSKRQAA